MANTNSNEYFCLKLPKIDLHCHLSGCFKEKTLNKTRAEKGEEPFNFYFAPRKTPPKTNEEWSSVNDVFFNISKLTGDIEQLRFHVSEVIEEIADQGIIYSELRIGLKKNPTMEIYLQNLIEQIKISCENNQIDVRLLLTIARHQSVETAKQIAKIALKTWKRDGPEGIVVGIDFAGNPYEKHFSDFESILEDLRKAGLKITLHCGESFHNQEEWKSMIEWKPDRLGHCVFINEECREIIEKEKIPVEICLTVAKHFYCIEDHSNMLNLLKKSPKMICTDNPTLNDTHLSQEYLMAMNHFNLNRTQISTLAKQAIDYAFCSTETKQKLHNIFNQRIQHL